MITGLPTSVTEQIKQLRQLYQDEVITKDELRGYIQQLMAGKSNLGGDDNSKNQGKADRSKSRVRIPLDSQKSYRGSASPETSMVRRCVDGPMRRRFQLQCTISDSPLWSNAKPRRLNKTLFNAAVESPLEEVITRTYTVHTY